MFGNSQMGGIDFGTPDVCLTQPPAPGPPVPMPYPDFGVGPMGVSPATKIMFMCAPSHNMGTTIKQTNGDNLGVATGVASGTVMGPSRSLTGAFSVLLLGKPATRLTSVTLQNSTNVPGARVAPSQTKVLLLAP